MYLAPVSRLGGQGNPISLPLPTLGRHQGGREPGSRWWRGGPGGAPGLSERKSHLGSRFPSDGPSHQGALSLLLSRHQDSASVSTQETAPSRAREKLTNQTPGGRGGSFFIYIRLLPVDAGPQGRGQPQQGAGSSEQGSHDSLHRPASPTGPGPPPGRRPALIHPDSPRAQPHSRSPINSRRAGPERPTLTSGRDPPVRWLSPCLSDHRDHPVPLGKAALFRPW